MTRDKYDTVPHSEAGAKGGMGLWMHPDEMKKEMDDRFKDCMAGRSRRDLRLLEVLFLGFATV